MSLKSRLTQLDGLRGLAIILVFFAHARLLAVTMAAPSLIKLGILMLTNNGGVGVAILFLLSGYLMKTIYPIVPSAMAFWQKRYTRIFPGFLTMTFVLSFTRYFGQAPWWLSIFASLIFIWLGGMIWSKIRLSHVRKKLGSFIFRSFLWIQILAVIGYIIFQNLVASAVFLQLWPKWQQALLTWFVNASMSLPFGTYIAQLDGVYWSICTEVLFYLLYPRIFLPVFNTIVNKKSWLLNITSLISSAIFFYSIGQICQNILGLHLLQLHMTIFFILGMAISQFENSRLGKKFLTKLNTTNHIGWSTLAIGALFGAPIIWKVLPIPTGINLIIWSIPLAMMFFLSLVQRLTWTNWLQTKWLRLIGTVSYAIYLTHTLALETFVKTGEPTTVLKSVSTLVISIITTVILATLVHKYLERPYFVDKFASKHFLKKTFKININQTIWLITISYFIAIWLAFRTPISILATQTNHRSHGLSKINPITPQPLVLNFTAQENHLGMLIIHLEQQVNNNLLKTEKINLDPAELIATLKLNGNIIQQTKFPIYQIYQAKFFTIGLPIQKSSHLMPYQLELGVSHLVSTKNLVLINDDNYLKSIYFPEKQTYIRQPKKILWLGLEKIFLPFTEWPAQIAIILSLPMLVIFWSSRDSANP